jgi:alpha-N-arabinofuranosidase
VLRKIHGLVPSLMLCVWTGFAQTTSMQPPSARISVDTSTSLGIISPFLFGQNLEYEHGAISGGEQNMDHAHGLHTGGLWAEILRNRKFDEGDLDRDGVSNAWVPEERITNHMYDLLSGRSPAHRYEVDTTEYFGGGASQKIYLSGNGTERAGVVQVELHFTKGVHYAFYVYLKREGKGGAWVAFSDNDGHTYDHQDFGNLTETWTKYQATFVAPETTEHGHLEIGVVGSGNFWIDSASLMPADNLQGMRSDVVTATARLDIPILRYPGGCFADTYHWRDGIGDRDRRPERWSDMWNEWEPNDFGFDDFMTYARTLGFEPQITLNYLTSDPAEAAQWVQYANGSIDTPMGKLRAQNGHAAPYNIKYWAVGNEAQQLCSDAYFSHDDVDTYAKRFQEYRKAIKRVDPSIEVMASGAGPGPAKWNADLLERVNDIDSLGVSIYTGWGNRIDDFDTKIMDPDFFYNHLVAEPLEFSKELDRDIESTAGHPTVRPRIAVTEFQAWWLTEKVDEDLRLPDALYLGMVYNALFRRASQVRLAEIESLINIQGVVEVSQTSLKLTPEYFASLLYKKHTGQLALTTTVSSPPVSFDKELPALDGMATLSSDRKTLYLSVINRDKLKDIEGKIDIPGWKLSSAGGNQAYELNGNNYVAANPFGSENDVNIKRKSVDVQPDLIAYRFPAHSITILELHGADVSR